MIKIVFGKFFVMFLFFVRLIYENAERFLGKGETHSGF